MNDPEAIRFINEHIRPRCEMLRDLKILMEYDLEKWYDNSLNTTIPNDDQDPVEDGRASEGVSQLTCADIHTIMSRISEVLTPLQAAGAMDVVNKACVRTLSLSL